MDAYGKFAVVIIVLVVLTGISFFRYVEPTGRAAGNAGPYGLFVMLLSIFIVVGIAVFVIRETRKGTYLTGP